jgi:FkbM family methyltransferase
MPLRRFLKNRAMRRATSVNVSGIEVSLLDEHIVPEIRRQIYLGEYEVPEITAARKLLRDGDKVLELGTGLGIVTAIIARNVGVSGKIRTFEANPRLLEPARKLFLRNAIHNVEAVHGVLIPGTTEGTRTFHFAKNFPEGSLRLPADAQGAVEVSAIPLAQVISSFRPDVLVCDIEGAEAELIPALDASGLRAAVIELHPHRLSRQEVAAIYDNLARQGLYPMIECSSGTVVAFERVT